MNSEFFKGSDWYSHEGLEIGAGDGTWRGQRQRQLGNKDFSEAMIYQQCGEPK